MLINHPQTDDLSRQVALWYTRLESGGLSAQEKADFEQWLTADEAHFRAFSDIGALSGDIETLFAGPSRNPGLEAALLETDDMIARHRARKIRRRLYRRVAAMAAVILLGVGVVWRLPMLSEKERQIQTYQTAVGHQKTVLLGDGSVVTLNTNSEISVSLTDDVRRLHLKKGEVYFEVAKDKMRPFEVAVQNAFVKAVGTAFNVRKDKDAVIVLVTEGTVEVKSAFAPQNPTSTRPFGQGGLDNEMRKEILEVGDQIAFGEAVFQRGRLADSLINRKILWREGRIILDEKSLAEVMREIQPYIPEKIIIADDEVAALRGGGVFKVGETRPFFDALEAALPIKVVREKGIIILRRHHAAMQNTTKKAPKIAAVLQEH